VDEAFVEATLRLLSDGALRERLGEAARAKVQARYSWQAQVQKMDQVYVEMGV
jgi:glycosyltransferase involved in cell wall biosynthesis